MNPQDVSYNWLSSGGAYKLLFLIWIASAVFFAFVARNVGRAKNSPNDGCLLGIATTVFTFIGGAIGLLLINKLFPWFILTSVAGSILAPALTIRTFQRGRAKY